MNPMITEQLDKFKTGDFSGYESFYNETVQTVYTMLHTLVNDQNVATSLVPQVYDKIYRNVADLEQTEGFYQWAAGYANEEALCYLKTENLTGTISADPASGIKDQTYDGKAPTESLFHSPESGPGATESFYDYALEDAELTITEDLVSDNFFVSKLQGIVNTLSPIERVVFQDYYYFGTSVPEIAAKTGCKDTDIRYTLNRTRTEVLQVITEASAAASGNPNHADTKRYHLSDAPWMWIAYQNFLGYTLGIDTVSIAGWSLGVLGQAVGTGSASAAGAAAAGSTAAAGGASGLGGFAAALIGTIGGKIALGVIGAALVTSIGFGVHHVVANQDREGARQNTPPSVTEVAEATEETTVSTTEAEVTTEATTQATTETTTEANGDAEDEGIGIGASKIDHEKEAKRAYKEFLSTCISQGYCPWSSGEKLDYISYMQFFVYDIDFDGIPELLIERSGPDTASMWQFTYKYNTSSSSVDPYFGGFSGICTVYSSGYLEYLPHHMNGTLVVTGPDIGKVINGTLTKVYHVDYASTETGADDNGNPLPVENDVDGNGRFFIVTNATTGEVQYTDDNLHNIDSNLGTMVAGENDNYETIGWISLTTENVNTIK